MVFNLNFRPIKAWFFSIESMWSCDHAFRFYIPRLEFGLSFKSIRFWMGCYCIAAASIDPSRTLLTLDPLARLIGIMGSSGVDLAPAPPEVEGPLTFLPIGTDSVGAEVAEDEVLSQPDPQ